MKVPDDMTTFADAADEEEEDTATGDVDTGVDDTLVTRPVDLAAEAVPVPVLTMPAPVAVPVPEATPVSSPKPSSSSSPSSSPS